MAELNQSLPEFETIRRQNRSQFNQQRQGMDDAVKRRFASMNALNTGAAVKTLQQGQDQVNRAEADAGARLGFQEAQVKRQMAEAEKGRDFQAKMLDTQQRFQDKWNDRNMEFQRDVFSFDVKSKLRTMDLADRQFELDKETTEFNKRMALLGAEDGDRGMFGGKKSTFDPLGLDNPLDKPFKSIFEKPTKKIFGGKSLF